MGTEHVGYVEFDDKIYRFNSARCSFKDDKLYVMAAGDKCELWLPGVPFPGASAIVNLPGKVYDSNAEVVKSTGMSEGYIKAAMFYLSFNQIKVNCKRVDSLKSELALSFQAEAEDRINGGRGDVDCGVRCEVDEGGCEILRRANKRA